MTRRVRGLGDAGDKVVTIDVKTGTGLADVTVSATIGGTDLGFLATMRDDSVRDRCRGYVAVVSLDLPTLARRGIGTMLYHAAAKALERQGCTLASSPDRTPFSEAFWRKQTTKGRADCVDPRGARALAVPEGTPRHLRATLPVPREGRWSCRRYELRAPVPASLAGLRRGKRSRRG